MGHKTEGLRALGILPPSAKTGKGGQRERIQENGISLTLVTNGLNVGRCVDVSPVRQVEIPVPGSSHFAGKIQGRGQPDVGS